jgi:Domain of unknown function (DUF5668)
MSDRIRCNCRSCTIRSLMGPAVLITVGVLFLLEETHGGFSFRQTWPVMLVVIGIINLASAMAPTDGHISSSVPPVPPAGTPIPPANPAPGNYPRQGQ